MSRIIVFILCCLIVFSAYSAKNHRDTILKVGVINTPPFVIYEDDGTYSGLCVDMWENVADLGGLQFEYIAFKEKDIARMIDSVESGYIDICIEPLTVTSERLQRINFSQPVFISNLAVAMQREDRSKMFAFVKNIISISFLKIIAMLFGIIFFFGIMLWFFERKANPEQFRKGLSGIGDGIWWSAVTMTTVGYGDKSPVSRVGRFIAIVWMFTAVIIISSFTAGIASALTVSQLEDSIDELQDLKSYKVGTIVNSSSAEILSKNGISYHSYISIEDMLEDLSQGIIKAVVYDKPLLQFAIHEYQLQDKIGILSQDYTVQYYSFSMSYDDTHFEQKINKLILHQLESEHWDGILKRYFLE